MRRYGAVLVLLVSACQSVSPVPDTTPPPINPAAVPDAVPRADPITVAGNKSPYSVNGVSYTVLPSADGYVEEGVASWYGLKFHGRKTSNGERFSVYGPTAAHKTLPIPSYVRVTNLENGKSMILRVNDRGPFHGDRLIDLSYGAALKLGYAEQGTARVRVEAITVTGADDQRVSQFTGYRYLQLGAFSQEQAAIELLQRAGSVLSVSLEISPVETPGGRLYRLRAGPFEGESALRSGQKALVQIGLPEGQPLP